ncbi:MAG: hypothetical protein VXY34_10040 [Bdellovibrionota bacterium]|nr:hypothetical protein [Bdellovibrionota bacterium]MEC8625148.1 hypothetical protein [Bdellovibrionota bacterium]
MKLIVFLLFSFHVDAGLFSESAKDYSKDLAKIGDRITRGIKKGTKVNWSCSVNGVNYCEKEKLFVYDTRTKEVEVSGKTLKTFLADLRKVVDSENKCLGKGNEKYHNAKTEKDLIKLSMCLKGIEYKVRSPPFIKPFGIDYRNLVSPKNRDILVTQLEGKANNLKLERLAKEKSEKEIITNKKFNKIQKRRKSKFKGPYLLASHEYVSNPKRFMGRKYKILVIGDRIINLKGNKSSCAFNYLKVVNEGFNKKTGKGNYYFESLKGIACSRAFNIKGQDVSSVTLVVQFDGISKGVNGLGQAMVIPVFKIVEVI